MKQSQYDSLLALLPIENPTHADIAALCPHLKKGEAVHAFARHKYVACPPLRVRGAFQILELSPSWIEEIYIFRGEVRTLKATKYHPPTLRYAYAGRTLASYADGQRRGDVFHDYACMDKAMKFAEANWGNQLVQDNWVDVVEFYIQDPTDLHQSPNYARGTPKTKAILRIVTNRGWNDVCNDRSKPESQLIDDAIVEMTLDQEMYHELKGGRGGYTMFNCAHCGSGLGLSGCSGCNHTFRDDKIRGGWDTPLSPKMVRFLQNHGHIFGVDPKEAWNAEEEKYKRVMSEKQTA